MKNIFQAIAELLRAVIDPCGAAKWINAKVVVDNSTEQ